MKLSNAPLWRFAQMSPSEINQDPVQGEFFTAAADLPERLVRETVQNSLDARHDDQKVRIRFVFSGSRRALTARRARPFLAGLEDHVRAVVAGNSTVGHDSNGRNEAQAANNALDCFDKPMSFLTIEDFGTTGLTGNLSSNSERESGNNFWGFFRSIGISPKGENDGGSWGLGKWVFPDASEINAYLGITQRSGDEQRWLLMGMAALKTHTLNKKKYPPYGTFAAGSSVADHDWLPLPVDDEEFILEVCESFGLERLEGTGLSVIVPFPRNELGSDSIARAVITQYFFPIVSGQLEVEIVQPSRRTRHINADSIQGHVDDIGGWDRRRDPLLGRGRQWSVHATG